jgi:hypothetical protein
MNLDPKRSILPLFLVLGLASHAQDQNYADCVTKAQSNWGQPCPKCEAYTEVYKRDYHGVYQIELKNTCNEAVELKVAMQESNGRWRTFPIKALAGGETMTAFACNGTGKYLYWARRLNDTEILLPSDQEILTEYRDRR